MNHEPTPTPTAPLPNPLDLIHQLDTAGATLTLTEDSQHLQLDAPPNSLTPEIRAALKLHKLSLLALLRGDPIIPRLPRELETLIRQAQVGGLQAGPEGVGNWDRYVMSWAASYALGDREHVLEVLWSVWKLNHPEEPEPVWRERPPVRVPARETIGGEA